MTRSLGQHRNKQVFVGLILLSAILGINYNILHNLLSIGEEEYDSFQFQQPPYETIKTSTTTISSNHSPGGKKNKHTSHWCHSRDLLNDNRQRATCLFHNICVVQRTNKTDTDDPHEVDFLYVNDDDMSLHNIAEEASFTLGIGPHSGDKRILFSPIVISSSDLELLYPQRKYVDGTAALFYEYNAENFGHLLMDVLLPVFVALESFGLADKDVLMYRYSILDAIGWSCDYQKQVGRANADKKLRSILFHGT